MVHPVSSQSFMPISRKLTDNTPIGIRFGTTKPPAGETHNKNQLITVQGRVIRKFLDTTWGRMGVDVYLKDEIANRYQLPQEKRFFLPKEVFVRLDRGGDIPLLIRENTHWLTQLVKGRYSVFVDEDKILQTKL